MKLKKKLATWFFAIFIVAIILNTSILLFFGTSSMSKGLENHLDSVIVLKENALKNLINSNVHQIENIAKRDNFLELFFEMVEEHDFEQMLVDPNVLGSSSESHLTLISLLSNELGGAEDIFLELFVLDLNGVVHLSTDYLQTGKIKSNELYFKEGLKGSYVQKFYYDFSLQKTATTISVPIKDQSGNVVGVLAGRMNLQKVSDLMTEWSGLGQSGESYLVNNFNFLVSESRFIDDAVYKKAIYSSAVKDCLSGNDGHSHFIDYRGEYVLGNHQWIEDYDLCLLVKVDHSEVFSPLRKMQFASIFLVLLLSVIFYFINHYVANSLSEPILELSEKSKAFMSGRRDVKLSKKIKQRKDELSELANNFSKMVSRINKYESSLEKEVAKKTKQLRSKVNQMQRFHDITFGREVRILELKEQVKDLKKKKANHSKKIDKTKYKRVRKKNTKNKKK